LEEGGRKVVSPLVEYFSEQKKSSIRLSKERDIKKDFLGATKRVARSWEMGFFMKKIRDIIELPDGSEVLNAIGWCLLSTMIGILGAMVSILLARDFFAY